MEILLVEDSLEDARATFEALQQGQVLCRISLVRDGDEAVRFLRHEGIFAQTPRPDLILLDIGLPKKHGYEVLADIRGDEQLRNTPVIVLTASLVHKAVLEAKCLFVDAYLTKPVSWDEFVTAVKSLRRSRLGESIVPS
jgi:two-component system, chemotaxis family, response regulator Rcp1